MADLILVESTDFSIALSRARPARTFHQWVHNGLCSCKYSFLVEASSHILHHEPFPQVKGFFISQLGIASAYR